MHAQYYGWDVGGAHLKFAALAADGAVLDIRELACPLWQGPDVLPAALASLAAEFGLQTGVHAISMTGELCDAFATRAAGVSRILTMLEARLDGALWVYGGSDWYRPASARERVDDVASMNWHATARYVAGLAVDACLLDIGSTTTDLIPLRRGRIAALGCTDAGRLAQGELVYTGVCRTPVMAVARRLPFLGQWRGIAAEYFATMADVYRITGELPASADLFPTADQRPADRAHSLCRLARMLGEDAHPEHESALAECARFISVTQLSQINEALSLIATRPAAGDARENLIGAGVGSFLARRLAALRGAAYRDFSALAGIPARFAFAADTAAPAVALARLAADLRL
jgi:probable H4MPT-linked C1 transfer pathway protein